MEGIYLHVGLATPQMIFHKHSPQNVYDFKMLPTLLFWWRLLIVFFFRTWYIDVSCKLHGCSVYEADIHSWSERSCLKREAKKGGIDSFYVHLTRCCLIFFVLKIRVKDEYCAFLKNLVNNYRYDLLKYFVNSMTAITFVINICVTEFHTRDMATTKSSFKKFLPATKTTRWAMEVTWSQSLRIAKIRITDAFTACGGTGNLQTSVLLFS